MNTVTSLAETPVADRLRIQLGWWFPSGVEAAEQLDQRLRDARLFMTNCHAATQAAAQRLRETISAANERIATVLAKLTSSQQPADLLEVQAEIGTIVLEAAAAHAVAWNEYWCAICECASRETEAPKPVAVVSTQAAKQTPAKGRQQMAETGAQLVAAS